MGDETLEWACTNRSPRYDAGNLLPQNNQPFFFRPMPAAASFVPKGTVGLAPDDDVVVVMVFDDVTDKRSNHIDDHLSWCVSNEADRMDDERKNGIYFTPNNDLRGYSL